MGQLSQCSEFKQGSADTEEFSEGVQTEITAWQYWLRVPPVVHEKEVLLDISASRRAGEFLKVYCNVIRFRLRL